MPPRLTEPVVIQRVADAVAEDDALALALACRALRDALLAHRRAARFRTREAGVLLSANRLRWARGLPGIPDWLVRKDSPEACWRIARAGHLAVLRFARADGCYHIMAVLSFCRRHLPCPTR